ncbi:hypothetical protein MANAM107_06880 [Actinomyces capricornis]|uniref:Transposase n=1 Tax=Actinomyces capricornis TaxID=2755559 RepID=A0ABN6K2M7_9ACTO|nr:hypothetical protein MANAM107_06880 [Actinomyces capricornis]
MGTSQPPVLKPDDAHEPGFRGCVVVTGPATTRPAGQRDTRPDLVERRFAAERPHQLWVADITYVRTLSGLCYTAFWGGWCFSDRGGFSSSFDSIGWSHVEGEVL